MKSVAFESKCKHLAPDAFAYVQCKNHKQPVKTLEVLLNNKLGRITLFCTKCEQPLAQFKIQNGIAFEE